MSPDYDFMNKLTAIRARIGKFNYIVIDVEQVTNTC